MTDGEQSQILNDIEIKKERAIKVNAKPIMIVPNKKMRFG
jgi:hypothetical protein